MYLHSITRNRFLSAWPRAGTFRAPLLKVAGCPVYFWTGSEVDDLLRRAGFQVESCETHGQLYCGESTAV